MYDFVLSNMFYFYVHSPGRDGEFSITRRSGTSDKDNGRGDEEV